MTLFALAWFLVALAPTAQIVPHHVARGDRFLYLPLVGLVAAIAWCIRPLGQVLHRRAAAGLVVLGAIFLVPLDWLSVEQVKIWKSDLSLWQHCVRQLPNNARARVALADSLYGLGQTEPDPARKIDFYKQAVEQYETALRLEPDLTEAVNNYALFLMYCDLEQFRNEQKGVELVRHGYEVSQGKDPTSRSNLAIVYENRATSFLFDGQIGPAIYFYKRAIETNPENTQAMIALAMVLMNAKDPMLRDLPEAIRLAERACALTSRADPNRLSVLAAAYAVAGHFQRAIDTLNEALELAKVGGPPELIDDFRRRLCVYQDRLQGIIAPPSPPSPTSVPRASAANALAP
jgi:tetratricopeptide (TPR) repeat protein